MNYCLAWKVGKLTQKNSLLEKTLIALDELIVELGIEFGDDDDEENTEDTAQLLKGNNQKANHLLIIL